MSDEIHAFLYLGKCWEMEVLVHTCTNVYSSDLCHSHLEFQSRGHLNKWRMSGENADYYLRWAMLC